MLAGFEAGKVDILIGTHRLLSRDVRAKDLGLVIVDEEQRFGVKQKELLRQLKLKVDVLALSATPIPRTLQMSLAGLRDISTIETPPEGRRPVRTYVGPYDEDLVAKAINRELERERPGLLPAQPDRLAARDDRAAARRWCRAPASSKRTGRWTRNSSRRRCSASCAARPTCLVTTTIIESGLDIANANTLIVERADQLGLSQAYQIRGRVGRSRERAFAYMLYPSAEALSEDAAARLSTLADHTELGSGFKIAMRDLDIRGAGDLLGEEQSGHVAAVGFELYCQMIDEAVGAAQEAARWGGGARTGAPRRPRRRLPAGLVHPLRGGEDRRPPPHRRRPRARRAAGDPRRDQRSLRRAAAAGGEPARPAAGPDRARPGRARAASSSAAAGSASPGSSSTPRPPASSARSSRGRSMSGASRPRRCACPTSRRRDWPRSWRWPRRSGRRGKGRPRRPRRV